MMKVLQYAFFILLLTSCNSRQKLNTQLQASEKSASEHSISSNEKHIDESPDFIDTLRMRTKIFVVFQTQNSIWITNERDTVFRLSESNNGAEMKDFNEDGFTDIIVHYITNVPGIYDLVLFDPEREKFNLVKNFSDFPAPQKIVNSNYYYSYHRSGCADANWDSDLFKIENNAAVRYGNIQGLGCEREEKNGIFIHRIDRGKSILIEEFKRAPSYYEDKWEFIKNYWTKNYQEFN